MTDRELLERAAKAAGVEGKYMEVWGDAGIAPDRPDGGLWNPLEDDADALRLAVKLRLSPEFDGMEVYVSTGADTDYTASENAAEHALDWFAAHPPRHRPRCCRYRRTPRMTDDIVTRLAREAALPAAITAHPGFKHFARLMLTEMMNRVEDCAKLCEARVPPLERFQEQRAAGDAARDCAERIRAKFKA